MFNEFNRFNNEKIAALKDIFGVYAKGQNLLYAKVHRWVQRLKITDRKHLGCDCTDLSLHMKSPEERIDERPPHLEFVECIYK